MERWVVTAKKADFRKIAGQFHIDPLTARVIRNRDVIGEEAIEEFLHGGINSLHQPRLMADMDCAMDVIQEGIRKHWKMRIIGDYDIDGVCASYILQRGIARLGGNADVYIPDRITDGYGLREEMVKQAAAEGIELLITCDNGIAAVQEVELAEELGMKVVVTDHHDIPYSETEEGRMEVLPPAQAVVNPKRSDCKYPFKGLCGAAVAWKLICAMYERYAIPEEEKFHFLEIVAVATVGDVMDLQGENRVLVREGLKKLQSPENMGLRALIEATGLSDKTIEAYHIGFVLGPCINASGRLDTAKRALNLLLAQNEEEAARLAGDLTAMNDSRKALTLGGVEEAMDLVESTVLKDDRVLVVYLPQCHESLAGIIAGRLREKYSRPTFVLTKSEEGIKGSGRSVDAYNMYEELVKCSDLLVRFGGHPMAAGLSMLEENIAEFREKLNVLCTLTESDLTPKVTIDVPVTAAYFTRKLVKELDMLQPYGKGNPRPLFAEKGIQVLNPRVFGKNRNVVQMQLVTEAGIQLPGVYFGDGDAFCSYVDSHRRLDIVYYPRMQEYRGVESLRICVQNYR